MTQDELPLSAPSSPSAGNKDEEEIATATTPENWPKDVKYLSSHSIPSKKLPDNLTLHLCTGPKVTHEFHPAQTRLNGWTCIKMITEDTPYQPAFGSDLDTHPTLGQNGLFAQRDIPPHTLVVCYLGQVHLASDDDATSRYDAAIESDDGTKCGIDATNAGNEARFVNDYRGILQRPNLFFQDWTARFPLPLKGNRIQSKEGKYPKKVKGLAFYSGAHSIRAGTELCASYGKGFWGL